MLLCTGCDNNRQAHQTSPYKTAIIQGQHPYRAYYDIRLDTLVHNDAIEKQKLIDQRNHDFVAYTEEGYESIRCAGWRNLFHIGQGNYEQFDQFATLIGDDHSVTSIENAMKHIPNIDSKDNRPYWSPSSIRLQKGTIIAIRDRKQPTHALAFLWVKEYGNNKMVLLMKTAD